MTQQLYGADLVKITTSKTEYTMKITHKPTGIHVEGKGDHEYALYSRLMSDLSELVAAQATPEA